MKSYQWIKQSAVNYLEKLHFRLASREARLQLALLGTLSGLIAGFVMVAFRLVVDIPQTLFLGPENPENYESLPFWLYLLLPTAGGLLVGILFQHLTAADRAVGIVHVMERLAYGEGHLPIKNAGVQFVSAALCILAGHSVGREGPSVHIGAACGSWIGQQIRLPNNSILVLVGCGSAGAIAAAFNTPLAGVIFAMEVILGEYTLASFTPIILAAVSATAVSQWMFGPDQVFQVPTFALGSLGDLFYIVLMGISIGILSALFVRLLVFFSQCLTHFPIWLRMTLAGALTGVLALAVPEILGIGYDTVNQMLLGNLGLELMLTVLACKLLATSLCLGLGLPGGVIGPTLVMGALAGGVTGVIVNLLIPEHTSPSTLYVMLGMGAMMGATLNAPLAALTALVELTANPHIILPGMLAIISAEITSHQGFNTPSVFLKLMQVRGYRYSSDPLSQFLRRLGVSHVMDRKVIRLPSQVTRSQINKALLGHPSWVLIQNESWQILSSDDLINFFQSKTLEGDIFDLSKIPVRRIAAAPIPVQATLGGALRKMDQETVNALCVVPHLGERILGVITRADIERSYRLPLN